uniref:Ejaculatory bulb-specific protein 3 n=1 Tax=Lygus hesperus TaxID=30085 RepID=A0A0A9W9Y3_LYGHE|nr:putative chemosensory protein 2 [Lygus hesperus]
MAIKLSVLSVVVLLGAIGLVLGAEKYTDKYDNIDLDEILGNQRLYQKYFDCIRGKGKCTPDGAELKESIPDALKTECAKCTDKQKKGVEKVLRFLIREKADDYKVLEEQYDPEGVYRKKYETQKKLAEEGKPIEY